MVAHPNASKSAKRPRRKRRVGLTSYQERVLKDKLRPHTCSEPWVEAQFISANDTDKHGRPILYRYHDARIYPPGGPATAMVRCKVCGVFNPSNAMEDGQCLDHADEVEHGGWGPSPSALAIGALQMRNLRLEVLTLEPEDAVSLRQEIAEMSESAQNEKVFQKCKGNQENE
jgi:hypothetical protein